MADEQTEPAPHPNDTPPYHVSIRMEDDNGKPFAEQTIFFDKRRPGLDLYDFVSAAIANQYTAARRAAGGE